MVFGPNFCLTYKIINLHLCWTTTCTMPGCTRRHHSKFSAAAAIYILVCQLVGWRVYLAVVGESITGDLQKSTSGQSNSSDSCDKCVKMYSCDCREKTTVLTVVSVVNAVSLLLLVKLEGATRYAGLLLATAKGFGQGQGIFFAL